MSASNAGAGRPPGKTAATIALEQEVALARQKYGATPKAIAEANNLTLQRVYAMLKAAGAEVDSEKEPTPDVPPELAHPPRRLSRRTAQARAWEYAEEHVISKLGLAVDAFWVRIVVAIHQEGDGYRLHIGEPGSRFKSREDLADLFGRRAVEIDDWLALLVERGRLIEIGCADIGIPAGLGLVPGENSRGEPMKPRAPKKPAASAQAPLPFRPVVVTGGRMDSSEIPPSDSSKTPISLESSQLALAAAAANANANANANAKESNHLAAAATESRAGDSSEIGVDSTKPPLRFN